MTPSSMPITSPLEGTRPADLTDAQAGLWYAQRLDPQNPVFNTGQYLEMRGALDVAAFKRAVDQAMVEADGLAWTVVDHPDGPRQQPAPALRPALEVIDVSGHVDPMADALAEMRRDMTTPIDLEREPATVQRLYLAGADRSCWYQRVHHVFIDGYGTGLLLRRVCDLYRSFVTGAPAITRSFAPYGPVLDAGEAYRASEAATADRAYWLEVFKDRPDVLGLAEGAAITSRSYVSVRTSLPAGIDHALATVAAASSVSWPDVLVALAGAYIQRHIGGREAVVGVPAMLRLGSVAARVPAMVMNVLPIRIQADETQPLSTVLQGLAAQMTQARKHGRYRSEQLRRDLGLLSDQRRLYGALINVLPFDTVPGLPGLSADLHVLGTGPVDDLTITFRADATGAGLSLEMDGNPRLYSQDELAMHGLRLAAFIDHALRAPALAEVPTVTGEEHRRWIDEVNETSHPAIDATLTQLIESSMAATPSATAVIDSSASLTYAELDARTAEWAQRLSHTGAGRGDFVAVLVPRSVELEIALVAILRAGAAYLPLDVAYPPERLRVMFESARPTAVLTVAALASMVPAGVPVMLMDRPEPLPAGGPMPIAPAQANDPAYVIYTSGSTGIPKGVVIQHRAIVNRLEWMRVHYDIAAVDRILQKTPATFDVSVWEFFLPLTAGASLVMAPPDAHKDPAWLVRLIRDHAVTTLHFVPSMLAQFVVEPAAQGLRVRRVFCSGEALPAALRDRFHEVIEAELHNLYGPTEAAVDVTYWDASRHDRSAAVPIGFPVWNTRMYVLDSRLRPLPAGVAGDLYIAGVQLAREYLGQPELTVERFIQDPFVPGERMYRTGDVAQWRADGAIEFLGRSDHQVKIRGLRIELGEIEAALMAGEYVAQAVVLAREDRPGDQRLVAYVVPQAGAGLDASVLTATLHARLPAYMVPAAIVVLEQLPVNSSGKLDRRRLPPPDALMPSSNGRPLHTAAERRLADLVSDVLGLAPEERARVDADSDFFALGGHSLLAAQLMRQVRDEWHCDLGLGVVFAHPTIAGLAAQVEARPPARRLSDDGLDVLLRLSTGPEAAPLFCIHPAGGISWCYGALARALSPARTVYGVQARSLDLSQASPSTLDEMAADYVREIKAVQPEGPYHLAGWSVGGIIAHAMACALEGGGDRVGTLAMLDAYPSDRWRNEAEPDESAALKALLLIAGLDPESAGPQPSRRSVLAVLRASHNPLGSMSDAALTGVVRVVENNSRLVRHHRHQRFAGDLLHFRAALDHVGQDLSPGEWSPYIGGVLAVHDVPSLHAHMTGQQSSAVIGNILGGRIGA